MPTFVSLRSKSGWAFRKALQYLLSGSAEGANSPHTQYSSFSQYCFSAAAYVPQLVLFAKFPGALSGKHCPFENRVYGFVAPGTISWQYAGVFLSQVCGWSSRFFTAATASSFAFSHSALLALIRRSSLRGFLFL